MSLTRFYKNMSGKSLHFFGSSLFSNSNWKDVMRNTALLQIAKKTNTEIIRDYCDSRIKTKLPPIHKDCYMTPNLFRAFKNHLILQFGIKATVDRSFDVGEFLEGVVEAQKVVSQALARGNYEFLSEIVAEEALSSIRSNVENLTPAQKSCLQINDNDLVQPRIYDVISRTEAANVKVVEIMVVSKYLKAIDFEEFSKMSLMEQIKLVTEGTFYSNYNFIRKYKEDVSSEWGINFINHFYAAPSELF